MSEIYDTTTSGKVRLIEYRRYSDVTVEFLNTGYRTTATMGAVKNGNVRDPMAPIIHGVGCLGERRATQGCHEIYNRWENMLERCYEPSSQSYHSYGGRGVSVDNEWLDFRNYRDWFLKNTEDLDKAGVSHDVDKDLRGGMLYSPNNCVILPDYINTTLRVRSTKESNNPYPGVFFNVRNGKYAARVSRRHLNKLLGNRSSSIGYYECDSVAFLDYVKEKEGLVRSLADYAIRNNHITEDTYTDLSQWTVKKALGDYWEMLECIALLDGHGDILNEYYRT